MPKYINEVHFREPTYFYIHDKVCRIKTIGSLRPFIIHYINDILHVFVSRNMSLDLDDFGVFVPIKETEEELKNNNIEYILYDRT